jgi:hypothetical protein
LKSRVENAVSNADSDSDSDGDNPLNQPDEECSDEEVQVGLQMLEAVSHVQNPSKGLLLIVKSEL